MILNHLFTVPMWNIPIPDFSKKQQIYLDAVYRNREKNPEGLYTHNLNGFQSNFDILHDPSLSDLFNLICAFSEKACFDINSVQPNIYITSAWANINDNKSACNVPHVHGDTFSGVVYLKSPTNSGNLVIENPFSNFLWQAHELVKDKNKFTSNCIQFTPAEGTFLLWPSYLKHYVTPNQHDEERISLNFNLLALPKEE